MAEPVSRGAFEMHGVINMKINHDEFHLPALNNENVQLLVLITTLCIT